LLSLLNVLLIKCEINHGCIDNAALNHAQTIYLEVHQSSNTITKKLVIVLQRLHA